MPWHVYIIRCKDGVLYTGVTIDLQRRLKEHRSGNGCRFTRYRTPVRLAYKEECPDRPQALKREAEIKRFPKKKKLILIKQTRRAEKIPTSKSKIQNKSKLLPLNSLNISSGIPPRIRCQAGKIQNPKLYYSFGILNMGFGIYLGFCSLKFGFNSS